MAGAMDEPEVKPPVAYTSELTPLEEAMATILPRWPDAYQAVLEYARELSGYVPPPSGNVDPDGKH